MAIPVAKRVRDVFYKHRASGMIEHNAMFVGMIVAELPYLLLMSVLFVLIYCATVSSLFARLPASSFILLPSAKCFHHTLTGWPIHQCWTLPMVCILLLHAHSIIHFLCAMLHVSS